jgi:hypothetical protein
VSEGDRRPRTELRELIANIVDSHRTDAVLLLVQKDYDPSEGERPLMFQVIDADGRPLRSGPDGVRSGLFRFPASIGPPRVGEIARLYRGDDGAHMVGNGWEFDVL